MPPKTRTPAPIDRPLSRAYLREFTGWSPEYPPGISDPTSLRIMENTSIQRDGSLKIRPGLRYLSIANDDELAPIEDEVLGSHEPFILNNGSKAYLFAVRESDETVGFRVLGNSDATGLKVHELDDPGIEFLMPQGYAAVKFTSATSYVKYLQIDNQIYALSNAGETMRLFEVGTTKRVKTLNAIQRPLFTPGDKLTVVHPASSWVASGVPTGERWNKVLNPSFEASTYGWYAGSTTCKLTRSTTQAMAGGLASGRMESKYFQVNLMPAPLGPGFAISPGWGLGGGMVEASTLTKVGSYLRADYWTSGGLQYINAPVSYGVEAGQNYYLSFGWERYNSIVQLYGIYRWFNSVGGLIGGDNNFTITPSIDSGTTGVYAGGLGTAPPGATSVQFYIGSDWPGAFPGGGGGVHIWHGVKEVLISPDSAPVFGGGFFDGDSGTGYAWEGTPDNSKSYYFDATVATISANINQMFAVSAGADYNVSLHIKAGSVGRAFTLYVRYYTPGFGALVGTFTQTVTDVNTSFTRVNKQSTAPAGATFMTVAIGSNVAIPLGEYHYIDQAMVENTSSLGDYFDGSYPDLSDAQYDWNGAADVTESRELLFSAPTVVPTAATPTGNTLISTALNTFNVGFFYTFSNEIGESAASQVTVVKVTRGWSQWQWKLGVSGEPTGAETLDPNLCADQLVAYMPATTFQDALDQGATKWSLYMCTWSNQDPAPVTAVRLSVKDLPAGSTHGARGWQRMTPQQADANAEVSILPSEVNRYNYSNPSRGAQGIVASDRMVLVYDPVDAAVIRWSSGQMGNYTDFTANRGGGYKTLTSGNMQVPACVKLWQNPQSADTLTILCLGTDGYSTGYYMAPAQIASQSEATNIMGFEETTATPGTVSPYGVEVMNNALYHPIAEQIMKSTATNYNINHSSITDMIQSVYRGLRNKDRIVSSMHDTRLYYLVHNPLGEALEPGCWGNEVWVFDGQAKAGSWSRWLVQGQSLRKFEQGDEIVMSLVRPDGIYYFDEGYTRDDYVVSPGVLGSRNIPWRIETNTQGANRAHDAWAHVQQLGIVVGNFQGSMKYGVRGYDLNGKRVVKEKILTDNNPLSGDSMPYDLEDFLMVKRTMKEWFFYAESVVDVDDQLLHSEGQINLVQYRYAPSTVNTGTELGSVETFEYGTPSPQASNGIPLPYIDTGRP